jgi:hypothetical protein
VSFQNDCLLVHGFPETMMSDVHRAVVRVVRACWGDCHHDVSLLGPEVGERVVALLQVLLRDLVEYYFPYVVYLY